MSKVVRNFINDERGREILEYTRIAGLIMIVAIAAITAVGGKVLARWNSLNDVF